MAIACCVAFFLAALSLELIRRSKPDFIQNEVEMLYPKLMSGVWVTGFEESSFFPGDEAIPDRNDDRRYRLQLIVDQGQVLRLREQLPDRGYVAFHVSFIGRRSKYPTIIDCQGDRHYEFVPDWFIRTRYLGPIADPDRPTLGGLRPPFKRSGEGGVIREMEDRALAGCSGIRR